MLEDVPLLVILGVSNTARRKGDEVRGQVELEQQRPCGQNETEGNMVSLALWIGRLEVSRQTAMRGHAIASRGLEDANVHVLHRHGA